MGLLGDQLVNVAAETRGGMVKTIVKIVEYIRKLLNARPVESSVIAGFHAVDAVAKTMCSGEETILTSIVPVAISYVRDRKCTPQALATLHSLM